jgi:hypothetical protein
VDANRVNGGEEADSIRIDEDSTIDKGSMCVDESATHGGRVIIVGLLQYRKRFLTDKKKMGAANEHGKDNMNEV